MRPAVAPLFGVAVRIAASREEAPHGPDTQKRRKHHPEMAVGQARRQRNGRGCGRIGDCGQFGQGVGVISDLCVDASGAQPGPSTPVAKLPYRANSLRRGAGIRSPLSVCRCVRDLLFRL
jgi:hypothetical protein